MVKVFKKKIFSNFFHLSVVQGSNFLIPLFLYPILIPIVGIEKFGSIALAQATMSYFTIITDYGFLLTATKDISIHRDSIIKVSEIFSNVFFTKLFLCFVTFFILLILCFTVDIFIIEYELYIFSFLMVVGYTFYPVWFFQGMEKMRFLSYLSLASKILFLILVWLFVRQKEDYYLVNFFHGVGNILAAVVAMIFIATKLEIKILRINIATIKNILVSGFAVFAANLLNNLYSNSSIFILKLVATDAIIGYFSIAEKIITALKSISVIVFQSVYPKASTLANSSLPKFRLFMKQLFFFNLVIFSAFGMIVFFAADYFVLIFSGNVLEESSYILRMLCIVPLICALNVPAYQTLIIFNKNKQYMFVFGIATMLSIVSNYLLSTNFLAVGTCVSIVITEVFITIALHSIIINKFPQLYFISIRE